MSKLFKYLGIGTAIGTLAYAVIKYKHDEKFKEKVDDVVDKAADFAADHPILTTAVFASVVMVPIMAVRKAMDPAFNWPDEDDDTNEDSDWINEIAKTEAKKQIELEISRKSTDIFNNWKEDYRDNWDRVNEFAKSLDLVEGESFMIEEGSQYDCDGTIVSHLINGEGCYPPETD